MFVPSRRPWRTRLLRCLLSGRVDPDEGPLNVAGFVDHPISAFVIRASQADGAHRVWTPAVSSHAYNTAARVRVGPAMAVTGSDAGFAKVSNPYVSLDSPSMGRRGWWRWSTALLRWQLQPTIASQISASAPVRAVLRVRNRPSQSLRSVSADHHSLLLRSARARSTRAFSSSTSDSSDPAALDRDSLGWCGQVRHDPQRHGAAHGSRTRSPPRARRRRSPTNTSMISRCCGDWPHPPRKQLLVW